MPQVIETFVEFRLRIGFDTKFLSTGRGSNVVFENGAKSDCNYDHHDPPADELELLIAQREYVSLALSLLLTQYRNDANTIKQQVEWAERNIAPPPDEDSEEHMLGLAAEIEEWRARNDELTERIDALRRDDDEEKERKRLERHYRDQEQVRSQRTKEVRSALYRLPTFYSNGEKKAERTNA